MIVEVEDWITGHPTAARDSPQTRIFTAAHGFKSLVREKNS